MSESVRVGNERCPACAQLGKDRRGDNLVRYDDGHAFCFSCGYKEYPRAVNLQWLRNRLGRRDTTVIPLQKMEDIFGELTYKYPVQVEEWLNKYELTELECVRNQIQWSEARSLLVIPVIDPISSKHIAYNCRYFGDDPKMPKYINEYPEGRAAAQTSTFRTPTRVFVPSLVLVEDQISGIKIARQAHSLALLGTHLPAWLFDQLITYSWRTSSPILVWLDPDKHDVSIKYSRKFRQYTLSYPILSDKDPKYYNDKEINGFLSDAIRLSGAKQGALGQVQ